MSEEEEKNLFLVVINHEEQYSIWPHEKVIPNGWRAEGQEGTKEKCLEYIEKVWTNMQPLSVRKVLESAEKNIGTD
ncbi:MbtH family NRPS accessory protein [uncultured Cyclobacterium sp.]|uniref:MbtH family protein n=1 Tax=uncultured Cyclobacterium sp. TaxID=453820 RepID=UPI0030EE6E67|tara:strand:- start:142932 stop:143159 length:228 start_codon:yes stop_codon:yes gene_type:complete